MKISDAEDKPQGRTPMTPFELPLARRTVIKSIGAGVAASAIGAMPAYAAPGGPAEAGEIWSSEYWAKKGDVPLWMFRR
jgi:hypothetical protein